MKLLFSTMDSIDVDVNVEGYLRDELSHSFLGKDPDQDLSIDINLADKKLSLGYDPILQEFQNVKLLEVCEKDEFLLPELQLDQLDSMMVAGEILPSTSSHSEIDITGDYTNSMKKENPFNPVDICSKVESQVGIYNLNELTQLSINQNNPDFKDDQPMDNSLNSIENYETNLLNDCNNGNNSDDNIIFELPNFLDDNIDTEMLKQKLLPSIMKKSKIESNNNENNSIEENGVMAIVSISTDKCTNLTQIVINTGKEQQIYQGKTSELMEATGYNNTKSKKNNNIQWLNSKKTNSNDNQSNTQDTVVTNAFEILGYSAEDIVTVTRPDSGKVWICPQEDCIREFSKLNALKSHLLVHFGIRPFKCDYDGCNWAFHSEFKLKRHKETHLKRKDFVCPVVDCHRRFTTVYNLWSHEKLHLRPNRIPCPVPECEEKFQTKRALEFHMKNHDQMHAPYVCLHEGCGKRYYSSNALTSHQRCHNYKEADVKCFWAGCGKIFDKPCRLKAHLRSHTGSKPYICAFSGCQAAFASSSKLKRHEKKHTNERKFICDIDGCNKAFMRSEHLKDHKIVHSQSKFFRCYICDSRFSAKSSLYVHIKKHKINSDNNVNVSNESNQVPSQQQQQQIQEQKSKLNDFTSEDPTDNSLMNNSTSQNGLIVSNNNNNKSNINPTKPKFICPIESCNKTYMTKPSLKSHTSKIHGLTFVNDASIVASDVNYALFLNNDNPLNINDEIIYTDQVQIDESILNTNLESKSCLTELESSPPVKKKQSSNINNNQRLKKSHGSARTGITYSDTLQMKNKLLTNQLDSIVDPSDIVLDTGNLSEGLLLTEELPSMYYQDDIVNSECHILLLDPSSVENNIILRDLD